MIEDRPLPTGKYRTPLKNLVRQSTKRAVVAAKLVSNVSGTKRVPLPSSPSHLPGDQLAGFRTLLPRSEPPNVVHHGWRHT